MKQKWNVKIQLGATKREAQFNTDGRIKMLPIGNANDSHTNAVVNATQQWMRRGFTGYPPLPSA